MKNKKTQNIILLVSLIVILIVVYISTVKFVYHKNMTIYFESTPEGTTVSCKGNVLGKTPFEMKYNIYNSNLFVKSNRFTFDKDFFSKKTVPFSYNQTKSVDTIQVKLELDKKPLPGYKDEFPNNYVLKLEDLRGKTDTELTFLRNEIYAKYGRKFITPKYKDYFNSKEWYKVNPHFSDAFLTETDKKNVALILSLENSPKTNKPLAEKATDKPEYTYKEIEVELYPDKMLIPEDLVCKTNEELALLRNEVYARHGRQFETPKYQEYFNSKSWYKINPEYSDALLTETDKANLALILDIETSIEENKDMIKKILDNPEYTYKDEKLIFIDEHNVKYLKSSNWGRIFCKYDYISSTGKGEKIVRWRFYKGEIFLCDYNKVWGEERRQISIVKLDLKNNTIKLIKRIEEEPEYYY